MKKPEIPPDEAQRLSTLRALDVLDSLSEERFDRVTRIARKLFGVQAVLVSLVDEERQWFKSKQGLDAEQTPRDISFCGHAILGDELFEIPDALQDERFCDNPLVVAPPAIRFYAGQPLRARNGACVGTLCLIDPKPRQLSEEEKQILQELAQMVEEALESERGTVDELTELSNQFGIERLVDKALRLKAGTCAELILISAEGLSEEEEEGALRELARALFSIFPEPDVIGRLSEHTFCIFITGELVEVAPSMKSLLQLLEGDQSKGYELRFGDARREISGADSFGPLFWEAKRKMGKMGKMTGLELKPE